MRKSKRWLIGAGVSGLLIIVLGYIVSGIIGNGSYALSVWLWTSGRVLLWEQILKAIKLIAMSSWLLSIIIFLLAIIIILLVILVRTQASVKKQNTELLSFLLTVLILLMLISLAALVYGMAMLINGTGNRDDVARQQRFLTSSILHMIARR